MVLCSMKFIKVLILFFYAGFISLAQEPSNILVNAWKHDSLMTDFTIEKTNIEILNSDINGVPGVMIKFPPSSNFQNNDVVMTVPYDKRPDSLFANIKTDLNSGDTAYIVVTLFSSDPFDPVGEAFFRLLGSSEEIETRQTPFSYFSAFDPDSLRMDIFLQSNSNESQEIVLDRIFCTYGNKSSVGFKETLQVSPNPSQSGKFYLIQQPHQYDEIIVKDISNKNVIYKASKEELGQQEIKIDMSNIENGTYHLILQKKTSIIRKRLMIK